MNQHFPCPMCGEEKTEVDQKVEDGLERLKWIKTGWLWCYQNEAKPSKRNLVVYYKLFQHLKFPQIADIIRVAASTARGHWRKALKNRPF